MSNQTLDRMKPILIIPKGEMEPEDIKRLNDNGICTVEAKNPGSVKFLDPIPAAAERSAVENAAIELSRKILNRGWWTSSTGHTDRSEVCRTYVELLLRGTRLDPEPTQAEREKAIFDTAKMDELRRLAREEAKAERAAAKEQAKQDAKQKP
jgi:hypothetical protein